MMGTKTSAKDFMMRYTPAAVALSLLVAVSSSVTHSQVTSPLDPRAAALVAEGQAALSAGNTDAAIDAFEAALTVNPGTVPVLLGLAEATRQNGMQGKALQYYRVALAKDPRNLSAIAGEGMALAEKGALDRASRNLARLKTLCGTSCPEASGLASVIEKKGKPSVMTAEASQKQPTLPVN